MPEGLWVSKKTFKKSNPKLENVFTSVLRKQKQKMLTAYLEMALWEIVLNIFHRSPCHEVLGGSYLSILLFQVNHLHVKKND